jgi:hypothetical protein
MNPEKQIMISPQLIDTLDRLPSNLQTEVLHYAQYLATQHLQSSQSEQPPTKYRQAGILQGMFTMADDFDAPLEDLKDYM